MVTNTPAIDQQTARIPSAEPERENGRNAPATLPPLEPDDTPIYRTPGREFELLTNEIGGLAASIQEVDARAAERLSDLSGALGNEESRTRWADVDLRRAFNTERIAHAWAVRKEGGYASALIETIARIRNVLVLLPLAVTWYAFYEASRAYDDYLTRVPEQSGTPMLVLWQRGFGGELPAWSRFSSIALIDVILIGLIIVMTFISEGRRDKRDDQIALTANRFQTDLDNVLGAATVVLAPDRANRTALLAQNVERLAFRFDRNSQELLNRLQVEHDRLELVANRREQEFSDFAVFASGMRSGAEETHRLLIDLRQVSISLQNALEDMTSEVGVSGDQQRTLLQAVGNLERIVASGIQSDQAVTRQLSDAANNLADAADRALTGSEAAAQAGRMAGEAVRGIAEVAAMLAESQARDSDGSARESESTARLAEVLRSSMAGVSNSSSQLGDIGRILTQLRDEFAQLSDHSSEQTARLAAMLESETGVAGQLSQVSRDLGASGMAVAQRERELRSELGHLMQQLGTVTQTLDRFAHQLPTTDAMHQAFASALRQELNGQGPRPVPAGNAPYGRQPERFEPNDQANRPAAGERSGGWSGGGRRPGQ